MRLRPMQATQAVRVRTTRAVLPDVDPRPFEWPQHPEWYAAPAREPEQPYDRWLVSDEQPEQEEEVERGA